MSTTKPKRTHLELASGRYLDYLDPKAEDICLDDIAGSLSRVCRWAGHCPYFYSVAEHACLVHDIVDAWGGDNTACLLALHHDDHEAYVGDVPTPLKGLMGSAYRELVYALDRAIWPALGLPEGNQRRWDMVKRADNLALFAEAHRFKPSRGQHWEGRPKDIKLPKGCRIFGLESTMARIGYLRRHRAITDTAQAAA